MEPLTHASLNLPVVSVFDQGTEPRPWSVQVKDQIRKRYSDLAENGFRPGGDQRALQAGYSKKKIETQPHELVLAYSGCGDPLEELDLSEFESVVDLGCGAGLDIALLAQSCAADTLIIGLDFTFSMLKKARGHKNNDRLKNNIKLILGDMEQLPIASNSIDLVTGNASFNLTLDKKLAFSEAARILRPGSKLVIRDLVREGELPSELQQDPSAWNTSLGGVMEEQDLRDTVSAAGFEQISISHHRAFPPVIAIRLEARKPIQTKRSYL
ncbi:methyltransferase domain-containing protein [Pseudomonadota bacterium]